MGNSLSMVKICKMTLGITSLKTPKLLIDLTIRHFGNL